MKILSDDAIAWKAAGVLLVAREGTGDNLFEEDIEEGYIDYIYYDIYSLKKFHKSGKSLEDFVDEAEPFDGGLVLLKEKYSTLTNKDIMSRVEDMAGIKED